MKKYLSIFVLCFLSSVALFPQSSEDISSLVSYALTPAGGCEVSLLQSRCNLDFTGKDILERPFQYNQGVYRDIKEGLFAKDIHDFLATVRQRCLLEECDGKWCPLGRSKSSIREDFENKIIEYVEQRYAKDERIVYTSFGSGLLFFDCRVLLKLIEKGYKNISLHCIDTIYEKAIRHILTYMNAPKTLSLCENFVKKYYFADTILFQCLTLLKNHGGGAITCHIYSDVESYVDDCRNDVHLRPHLIVSCDSFSDCCSEKDLSLLITTMKDNALIGKLYASYINPQMGVFDANVLIGEYAHDVDADDGTTSDPIKQLYHDTRRVIIPEAHDGLSFFQRRWRNLQGNWKAFLKDPVHFLAQRKHNLFCGALLFGLGYYAGGKKKTP